MNIENLTYLLQHPTKVNAPKTIDLEEIINEYPYFQSARAIHLKGLYNTNNFKYNRALKKTAAYTIDRKVLFEFITAKKFSFESTFENIENKKEVTIVEGESEINEIIEKEANDTTPDQPKVTSNISLEPTTDNRENNYPKDNATNILEIGKPIKFNSSEPHSFNEWMQLISKKPIERDKKNEEPIKKSTKIEEKFQLIDRFIESKPKIAPITKSTTNQALTPNKDTDNESLMTETLAKVYLEQQKFESAIKAYHILSLKYPEKSGFFADRIKAIKILQINKS